MKRILYNLEKTVWQAEENPPRESFKRRKSCVVEEKLELVEKHTPLSWGQCHTATVVCIKDQQMGRAPQQGPMNKGCLNQLV